MPEARDDLRWTGWAALAATAAVFALLLVFGQLIERPPSCAGPAGRGRASTAFLPDPTPPPACR